MGSESWTAVDRLPGTLSLVLRDVHYTELPALSNLGPYSKAPKSI